MLAAVKPLTVLYASTPPLPLRSSLSRVCVCVCVVCAYLLSVGIPSQLPFNGHYFTSFALSFSFRFSCERGRLVPAADSAQPFRPLRNGFESLLPLSLANSVRNAGVLPTTLAARFAFSVSALSLPLSLSFYPLERLMGSLP